MSAGGVAGTLPLRLIGDVFRSVVKCDKDGRRQRHRKPSLERPRNDRADGSSIEGIMKNNLRWLIVSQVATLVVLLGFGVKLAMAWNVEEEDLKTLQNRIDTTDKPEDLQSVGTILVELVRNRSVAYQSLWVTAMGLTTCFSALFIAHTLLTVFIFWKFKWAGYEDPSVVMRTF
jgi:hypothetical protein